MRGIKILLHDFALKMQGGGLCARGGVFAGHYGILLSGLIQSSSYKHTYLAKKKLQTPTYVPGSSHGRQHLGTEP